MGDAVTLRVDDGIGWVEIDNPPVNATSWRVRQGLWEALLRAEADPAIAAIVIVAAGRTFVAGGDITEFGHPPREPLLPDLLDRLEACPKPVVVLWHGTALGGGCEIGLAAHGRVMARDGKVGLPEVKLGLVPGAGGTQRLPRLIGAPAALELIASGRSIGAGEALQLGLVDRIAGENPRAEAAALARELQNAPLRRTSGLPVPLADPAAWNNAEAAARSGTRGREAPLVAIELVAAASKLPFPEGRRRERQAFLERVESEQSRALRLLFRAERAVGRPAEARGAAARDLHTIGLVGGGTMGSGIAVACLDAGYRVVLVETGEDALAAGMERIAGLYRRQMRSGRIDETGRLDRLARLTGATDLAALGSADLVIEAIFEEMAAKHGLFHRLIPLLKPGAVLATNTSYLDVEAMADPLPHPERFLGLHFFSPAHVMKLIEVVRARRTDAATLATGLAFARRLGKIPVVTGVCEGFIGNRILSRFRPQCEFLLEEGALPHEIDAALEAYGFAMGPFAAQDLAGLDIAWARRKRLAPTRDPAERDVPLIDRLCELGRFGQKAGRGWYRYEDGARRPDPDVEALVRAHAATTGRPPRAFSDEEIQARVLAAMVNEGAKLVGEGIAARPLDIDVVLVNGYGFPAWRGGPMHSADRIGTARLLTWAEETARRDGPAYSVAPLLAELGRAGRDFASLNRVDNDRESNA